MTYGTNGSYKRFGTAYQGPPPPRTSDLSSSIAHPPRPALFSATTRCSSSGLGCTRLAACSHCALYELAPSSRVPRARVPRVRHVRISTYNVMLYLSDVVREGVPDVVPEPGHASG